MEAVSTATVLTILGSAYGVMFATMISLMFVSIRAQHRENSKTRELITQSDKETRELITRTDKETREHIAQSDKETRELITRTDKETREHIAQSDKQTRELITRTDKETREHIAQSDKQTRELITRTDKETRVYAAGLIERFSDRLKALVTANHKATQEQFKTVNETLIDIRERLAFLEGAKHANDQHDEDGNQTSEAA